MQFLFQPGFSQSLLDAIGLVLNLDENDTHSVERYHAQLNEGALSEPIVFLFDESKKGVNITTRKYAEELGFRVFAYKIKPKERRDLFESALTILSLFPKALELIEDKPKPFLYTFRYKAKKFSEVKIKR